MAEFINYRVIDDEGLANQLYEKLTQEGITVRWESSKGIFDPTIVTNEVLNLYYLKLRKDDFPKADAILMNMVKESNTEPSADYYLYNFTDTELYDVLKKPDEWNEYDRYWAQKILEQRGKTVNEQEIEMEKSKRLNAMRMPFKTDKTWLLIPFIIFLWSLLFFNFFTPLGIILLGLYIRFARKTLLNGERVFGFSHGDRVLAKYVIGFGIACVIVFFWLWYNEYQPLITTYFSGGRL